MPAEKRIITALEGARSEIETGLAEAIEELGALDARRFELMKLITRARAALGMEEPMETIARQLTLHEAMELVLRERGNTWTSARVLADAINERGLYHKRDGSDVQANQIHARAKNYPAMFEKSGSDIRLDPSRAAQEGSLS